jgi:hypothetical protein
MWYFLLQVYVVMAMFSTGKALPCCWAFLPNKKEETYQIMWDVIMKKITKDGTEMIIPQSVSVDFESATIKILQKLFVGVPVVGCLFHFRQAIWRKLTNIGLSPLYFRDIDFQEWVHMVYSLSFVPTESVVAYYDKVILPRVEAKIFNADQTEDETEEETEDDGSWRYWRDEIQLFVTYLDRTWIGRKIPQSASLQDDTVRRGRPLFKHELWNQVKITVGEPEVGCSTNNAVERYNRTMKSLLGVNPNLWIIMQSLVCQEAETRVVLMNNAAGLDLTVNQGRKQEQKDIAFRLKSIVKRFADLSPELYLQCLAKHLNDGN